MPALRLLLLIAGALGIHYVGTMLVPGFSAVVDPFLVVLVFQALDSGPLGGLLYGILIGAVQDAVSGGLYGLYGFADTLVGYLSAAVAQRVVIQRWGGVMLAFLAAAAVQQLALVTVALVVLGDPELPSLASAAIKPLISAGLGLALWLGTQRGRQQYETWRRNRTARIHFR